MKPAERLLISESPKPRWCQTGVAAAIAPRASEAASRGVDQVGSESVEGKSLRAEEGRLSGGDRTTARAPTWRDRVVKATAYRPDGSSFIVLGLSRNNTEMLLMGKPIHVDLEQLGLKGDILIMGGETESHIEAELAQYCNEDTIIDDRRGKVKQ